MKKLILIILLLVINCPLLYAQDTISKKQNVDNVPAKEIVYNNFLHPVLHGVKTISFVISAGGIIYLTAIIMGTISMPIIVPIAMLIGGAVVFTSVSLLHDKLEKKCRVSYKNRR